MKIFANEVNRDIYNITEPQIIEVAAQCFDNLKALFDLEKTLIPESKFAGSELDDGVSQLSDLQLDFIEVAKMNLEYNSLINFAEGSCAPLTSIRNRVKHAVHYLEITETMIDRALKAYIPLSSEKVEKLRDAVYHSLAELAYFFFYQFRLDITRSSIKEGREVEVNVSIRAIMDERGLSVEKVLEVVENVLYTHKPKLGIFEAFPDLEDAFIEVAGPYLRDFERLADLLTVAEVRAVIEAKEGEVEQIVKSLEERIIESPDEGEVNG